MTSPRFRSLVNTVLWVLGAVMIGGALNTSVVSGEAPVTAPDVLIQLAVGVGLVVVGYVLRPSPEGLPGRSESDDTAEADGEAFEPELSPAGATEEDEPK